MNEGEQTKNAFFAPNRRDAYLKAKAETPKQDTTKEEAWFSLPEIDGVKYDPMALPNMAMPEKDPIVGKDELGFNIRETVTGVKYQVQPVNYRDVGLSERAENITENVGAAYEAVRDDPLGTATGLAKGIAQGIASTVSSFSDPNATKQDAMNLAGMMTLGAGATTAPAGALRSGLARDAKVPASRQRVPRFLEKNKPQESFGTKRLTDIFEEDKAALEDTIREADFLEGNNFASAENPNDLGYARSMDMNTLAQIKLGNTSVEDALDYIGTDPNPAAVDYINSRIQRLENNPEFNDYLNLLKADPTFDPYVKDSFDPAFAGKTIFRSAVPEVAALIDFPKKGLDGYQIIAELQKNPSLRKAELDTVLEEIDPKIRYSREEALDLISKNTWDVSVKKEDKFRSYQRQNELLDPELDYFELAVNAEKPKMFKAKGQHFDASTLAHTRASVRTDTERGYNYVLIEENQSDLLQHGFEKPSKGRPVVTPSDVIERKKDDLLSTYDEKDLDLLKIIGEDAYINFFNANSFVSFIEKVGPENLMPGKSFDEILGTLNPEGNTRASMDLLGLYANFKAGKDIGRTIPNSDEAWDYYDNLKDTYYNVIDEEIYPGDYAAPVSAPPIKKIEESVNITMDALIAEAAAKGITHIVMPPFERIVDRRFGKGTEEYAKALDPKSGFYKTYITSFQKYLKDAEEEFGKENFSWRLKDLDYKNPEYLPTTGTEIDFTGLIKSGYDFSRPRFAEGGMVEEEQMNRLMQEGGMADDGMSREPVTGNDIPPGALASEVRDNVDAKLSGGEYVVPADVLRYYGVRFFEDLRAQAKQGMMEMESEGRIGGVPVDGSGVPVEGQDEELTPEEEQMLAQAMSLPSGMAEGGVAFDRTEFTIPNYGSTGVGSPVEERLYFNPTTGEKTNISFMSGTAMGSIPAGFVPWTQFLQDTYDANKGATKPKSSRKSRDDNKRDTTPSAAYSSWADQNYNAITSNPFEFGMNALQPQEEADSKGLAGGLIGILTGKDKDIQNIANANAALKIMESKGLTGSENYKILTEKVKAYVAQISPLEQGLVLSKVAGTGNAYMRAIEEKAKQTPAAAPAASPVTTTPAAAPAAKSFGGQSADERREGTGTRGGGGVSSVGGSSNKDRIVTPARPSLGGGVDGPRPTPKPTPKPSLGGGVDGPRPTPKPVTGRPGSERFAEGGLVVKPKKTNPKSKGLGGKQ